MGLGFSDLMKLAKTGLTIEAQEAILEMRTELVGAKEEIQNLRARVKELEAMQRTTEEMEWDRPVYWRVCEGGKKREGPFCQVCWDKDKSPIRVQENPNGFFRCGVCGGGWRGPNFAEPAIETAPIDDPFDRI